MFEVACITPISNNHIYIVCNFVNAVSLPNCFSNNNILFVIRTWNNLFVNDKFIEKFNTGDNRCSSILFTTYK